MELIDLHCHSSFSFDSKMSAEELCFSAISKGLKAVAITDHYEADGDITGYDFVYEAQKIKNTVMELKESYRGKLDVIYGIEIGQPQNDMENSEKMVKELGFDYVLGSIHNLKRSPDFYFLKFELMGQSQIEKIFSRYLDEAVELVKIPFVTALAHGNYPIRYINFAGKNLEMKKFYDKFEVLFKTMIAHDTALEINTSPLRNGFSQPMPSADLVDIYRACGGELITVGSDAHYTEDVAANIEDAYKLLRNVGYKKIFKFSSQGKEEISII